MKIGSYVYIIQPDIILIVNEFGLRWDNLYSSFLEFFSKQFVKPKYNLQILFFFRSGGRSKGSHRPLSTVILMDIYCFGAGNSWPELGVCAMLSRPLEAKMCGHSESWWSVSLTSVCTILICIIKLSQFPTRTS